MGRDSHDGEEREGEEPEGEEPEGEEPEVIENSTATQSPVVPQTPEPQQIDTNKHQLRSKSRELSPLPPPASAKEKQLRELNESIRVNIAKKIIKMYGGVTRDLLQVASAASETLVTTQSAMNTMLSTQEALKRISNTASVLPIPLI